MSERLRRLGLWMPSAGLLAYWVLWIAPQAYDYVTIQQTLAESPELVAEGVELDARLQTLRKAGGATQTDKYLLKAAESYDCTRGAHAEMFRLLQIYDLAVEVMDADSVREREKDASSAWKKTPMSLRLVGDWRTYVRFKRALSAYPCLVSLTHERVVGDVNPDLIVADISLSIFQLPNEAYVYESEEP